MKNLPGILFLAIGIALLREHKTNAATIVNGSFETGNLSGWQYADLTNPYDRISVRPGGVRTSFGGFTHGANIVIPTQGSYALANGFSGTPGTIRLYQDVGVAAPGEQLKFDYRIGFDMADFASTQDSFFNVVIQPAGGGDALGTFLQYEAPWTFSTVGRPNSDLGPMNGMVDLSPYAGLSLRVEFDWVIQAGSHGPGDAQLDNVTITSVPEPNCALFGILALAVGLRRKLFMFFPRDGGTC